MKTIYILDAVAYLFRSFYAIRGMTNKRGEATNALYGFIRSVMKLQKDFPTEHIVAVFDGQNNKASRVAIYNQYKNHREGMPDDLAMQLGRAHEFCALYGLPYLSIDGVEADDTIGTIARWAADQGATAYMCSSDKDLCQLIGERIYMLNTHKNNLLIDREKVNEIYGIRPEQIIDYLAIMGDSSDNIPGIPGLGPKTASSLLQKFGTLEELLDHPDTGLSPKKAQTIYENRELALISKQLATIQLNVPIPHEPEFYALKPPDTEKLIAFYQDMNFATLLQEMDVKPQVVEKASEQYHLVDSDEKLKKLIHLLQSATDICIDTETTSLSKLDAEIVGIGCAVTAGEAFYVPTNGALGLEKVLSAFRPLLADTSKRFIGHNIKYDAHALSNHGIEIRNMAFDTMIASYLLRPERGRHSLDSLAHDILQKEMTPISALIGSGKKQISMRDVEINKVSDYCCADVDYTLQLFHYFSQKLKEENLLSIFEEMEMPLVPVLFAMERHGIFVDREELRALSQTLTHEIHDVEKRIYEASGETFNINSPKQLSEILFTKLGIAPPKKRGKTDHISTSASVLESLQHTHPICAAILAYRGLEKLRSTYADALPTQIHEKTRRIHCNFNQSVTATGRLSCQDPNLQNIPIRTKQGREIRKAFRPEKKGWSYFAADYSQIELRLLAAFSGEPHLIDAFKHGEDIHAFTASQVFGIPLSEVTKEMRSRAKAVNFGIIYGQQAFGLSQNLGISVSEAAQFISTYFSRYPLVEKYLEECKERARSKGYAETLLGRKRPLPDIGAKNSIVRSQAERLAVNSPLQGSQADIIKMAMIRIEKKMKNLEGFMILQIHDELVFEVPDDELETLQKMVVTEMESVVNLSVPLTVDIQIGKNWAEC